MNRLSLMCVLAVIFCAAFAAPAGAADTRPVMSGAMDICQAVDNGESSVSNGVEVCCAQEVTEFDDGHTDFGQNYCVACTQGTDDCVMWENTKNAPPMRDVKKALAVTPKQGTVTGN